MTHTELVRQLATKLELRPEEVAILWQQLGQIMTEHLATHGKIRVKNFGAFVTVKHKSRTVPDPREMSKKLVIFDQHLPKFRPSELLRAKVKDVNASDVEPEITDEAEDMGVLNDVPTATANDLAGITKSTDNTSPLTAPRATTTPAPVHTTAPLAAAPTAPIQAAAPNVAPVTPITHSTPIAPVTTTPATTAPAAPAPATVTTAPATPTAPAAKAPRKSTGKGLDISFVDLTSLTIDKEVLDLIPYNVAEKYQIIPVGINDNKLLVAMVDPGDREAIDMASRQTGMTIVPQITTSTDIQHALDQYGSVNSELEGIIDTEGSAEGAENTGSPEDGGSDAPAAKTVSTILERAVREHASDVHIEAEEKKVVIRFRLDGILRVVSELPKSMHASLISRLKIMSNLKIDESRLPQDGRLRMIIDRQEIDFRLSTLPTVNGEKIVMRILDKSAGIVGFDTLGMSGVNLERIEDNIKKSHGMLLVTGPTGSGKTTTLYAILGKIINPEINIITVEDPVEYRIPGINQSQVNSAIGYDFASGLRSIVRQDPDVILIGEIRDLETANIAIQSALTGHVVLSTLHTNDSAGAIPRLIDMGIEPFLITSSTNVVAAQRLVRKVCDNCRAKKELPPETIKELKELILKIPGKEKITDSELVFYQGQGCEKCNKSGYKGRVGIYEVLAVSEEIKQLALKRVSSSELMAQAIKEGMITLQQDGLLKALAGITTIEEVWRVTKD